MKKSLLFIVAITLGFSVNAQWTGFEWWTTYNVQTLDDYETSANDWGIEGANAAYQSTDAQQGLLSIRLESVLSSQGDTIFGYFLSGDPDIMQPGQPVSIGAVDSIVGWYKYDILPGDSSLVIAMTTFSSTLSGGGMYYIPSGTQSTWKRFAYYIGAPAADSLLLAAAVGDPVNNWNGKPGSWIQYDNVQLVGPTGTMNVLNYSFENWSPITWEEPNGWFTSNIWAIGEPVMPAVKTLDSYAGNYALSLNMLMSTKGDTLWGAATNGTFGNNGPMGGEPFAGTPTGVECYYKYAPSGTDTAYMNFEFRQGGNIVGSYGAQISSAASSYTLFNNAISAITPDTVLISFWTGKNIGSQLKVDNVNITFPVGIAEGLTVEKIVTYPNPATDVLNIKFNIENDNNVTIRLIDAVGKELTSHQLGHITSGTYKESFNTSKFTTGVYFIEFTLGNEKIVKRFAIK